jgi:hypothetical protein
MSQKYLLPCRCGQSVAVATRQAGQTTVCTCGATLLIPTMREIAALEPAPDSLDAENGNSPSARGNRQTWGAAQVVFMLGILLSAAGVISFLGISFFFRPIPLSDNVNFLQEGRKFQTLPPGETWLLWIRDKQSLSLPEDRIFFERMKKYHLSQWLTGLPACAGFILLAVGAAMASKQRRTTNSPRRRDFSQTSPG